MWTLAMVALAQPSEEITVYADAFARWDETRWLVETELMVPFPTWFTGDENHTFRSHAYQIRAIVACDKDARLSRKSWEILCEVEDIGLIASTVGRWRGAAERAHIQQILDQIDAKLTGAQIQLQVDQQGALRNVDIEGLASDNLRERRAQEFLRLVMSRLMAGFHLRFSPRSEPGDPWLERNSLLLQLPSTTGVRGSTRLSHSWVEHEETSLIHSTGQGTIAAFIPYIHRPGSPREGTQATGQQPTSGGEAPTGDFSPVAPLGFAPPSEFSQSETEMIAPSPGFGEVIEFRDAEVIDLEAVYALQSQGVAIYDRKLSFVTERMWRIDGQPTSSSAGGVNTAPYHHRGTLRLLGEQERPDVGPSAQVAPPGSSLAGMPSWVPLEVL